MPAGVHIRLSLCFVFCIFLTGVGVAAERDSTARPPQPYLRLCFPTDGPASPRELSIAPVSGYGEGFNGFSGSVQVALSGFRPE